MATVDMVNSNTSKAVVGVFSRHPYLIKFFFDGDRKDKLRFRPDEMRWRIQDMQAGEQVLVKVALDIWSGSGDAKVSDLLEILDEGNFSAVIQAFSVIKADRSWPYDQGEGFSL